MSRDGAYLLDILGSARAAVSYLSRKTQAEFLSDQQCQDAVIRRLEIIGEAARRVSQETRTAFPHLPWAEMVSMRNRMIHVYDDVDLGIVWDTVRTDLPELVHQLEPIVAGQEGQHSG